MVGAPLKRWIVGVGRSRRAVYWEWLRPEEQKAVVAIKAALDPLGIMNPGCLMHVAQKCAAVLR
ncbi:MAG: FAD-binding oxidoreductase [Mesorhizobium sp.]|nr:MAG: FAD-binding oxidoreductase [Mesorhizobium sp.]RWP83306.1 MAG: FAD-binding oxidoreductase [Mesorhizobium sp.]RWQ41186.1 MAG: FAD-binding oxidoreductase [Mesorhizobium sp.]